MYSKTILEMFEIGRFMSENEGLFEGFVEYRVEAINTLKRKLKNMNIPSQIKENLLATLFTLQKSQNLYEYYAWQRIKLHSRTSKFSRENFQESLISHADIIESQITEALEKSNTSIDYIKKNYKNILNCIDTIAEKIKSDGSNSIDEIFILDTFNVKNKQSYTKK